MNNFLTINEIDCVKKRIFLRLDLNVPLENGIISNDFRLKKALPTIEYLNAQKANVIIGTHLGRPKNQESHLSTKQLLPWFKKQGLDISFVANLEELKTLKWNKNRFFLLENLRFFAGEKSDDIVFARQLAQPTELYIDDAFAALHRKDTSIYIVPTLYPPEKRGIGLLIENELYHLSRLRDQMYAPRLLLIGGSKIKTKLPFIQKMLYHSQEIVLLPPLVFTFLKAQGIEVGRSLVEESMLDAAREIIVSAKKCSAKLTFPRDYYVQDADGAYVYRKSLRSTDFGIAIGKQTLEYLSERFSAMKAIFFNGAMGFANKPDTLIPTKELVNLLQASAAYTVIGGGDTVSICQHLSSLESINFISTGGGATLAFIAQEKLPGLEVLSFNKLGKD